MPLSRYFLWVGGVLLALLFVVDLFLPKLQVAAKVEPHLPTIRIYSDKRWPERIVLDTSVRTSTSSPPTDAEPNIPAPSEFADIPAKAREALAQLQSPDPNKSQSIEPKKRGPKPQPQHKRVKRPAPPPTFLAARQPPFGWSGNRAWW